MQVQNGQKNKELDAIVKAFTEKAPKELKKQYDDMVQKSLDEAVSAMKKLAKSA